MENLIPVLVIGGIVVFLLWKNKDKIVQLADKFTDREKPQEANKPEDKPESGAIDPERGDEFPIRALTPATAVVKPTIEQQTGPDNWLTRANKPTDAVAAYRDGLVEASRDKFDPLENLPKLIPGNLLLGGAKHLQFLVTFGPTPKDFAIAVPEGYKGSVYFDLTPHPTESNGDAYCQFVVTDWEGKKVADVQGRLDSVKLTLSGKAAKGKVKVSRGTYLAKITASKDCRTLFLVSEA